MRFEFNQNELQNAVSGAMRSAADDAQARVDRVYRKYASQPVHVVESALRRELKSTPLQMTPAAYRDWAQLISDGKRVVFTTE